MSPYAYSFDDKGRRLLLGLTLAETAEFEALERQVPTSASELRWLELYNRHVRGRERLKKAEQLELI